MLPNCEKAIIIDALRNDYCLKELLDLMNISKSSYFYQHNIQNRADKYTAIRKEIAAIFSESGNTYGYRRIHAILKGRTITVFEKVIRRLMKEEKLVIKKVRIKKYSSYQGEISEAFFGRLKNEMFYNHLWIKVSIDEFIDILDTYIRWYSTSRIKLSLGAMSPLEYRRSLGLIA